MEKRNFGKKISDFFLLILKDPERKSIIDIFLEYAKYKITNQAIAEKYFSGFLYRKGVDNHEQYLVNNKILRKCWNLNNKNYLSILDNKHSFELFFSSHNINIVKSQSHNINTLFFTGNSFVQIHTIEEFIGFLKSLLRDLSGNQRIFVKKKEGSYGGKDIFTITGNELKTENIKLRNAYNQVIKSGYLFQDEIRQHEQLNKLNPHCLNTLRIDTFTDKQQISSVFSCHLKVGTNRSHVDNISSGGAYVGVNLSNGTLYAEAFTDFTHGKGQTYKVHPLSNVLFEGFEIPFYKEATDLAIAAAKRVPQIKVIGWDVAIQPDGPLLVEGNEKPHLVFSEIGQKGFLNNPVFMELLKEANEK